MKNRHAASLQHKQVEGSAKRLPTTSLSMRGDSPKRAVRSFDWIGSIAILQRVKIGANRSLEFPDTRFRYAIATDR